MKIFIGTDHVGYEFKNKLIVHLKDLGYEIEDKGAFVFDKNDDYPDFITPVAEAVAKDSESVGIILGGSGQGEAMCANRVKGVRAMVFYGMQKTVLPVDATGRESVDMFEIINLSRGHDSANIISLGMCFISEKEATNAVDIFLKESFSNVDRYIRRINKF
ncbi:MAG: RpiB/LacA/LacB family sugar-phosphate isomerase [bacterium]|nr:RpiB/LacA/LacB family sugar-phosphate isomerase [bacterium]